jgi:hypothetical protein
MQMTTLVRNPIRGLAALLSTVAALTAMSMLLGTAPAAAAADREDCDNRALLSPTAVNGPSDVLAVVLNDERVLFTWKNTFGKAPCRGLVLSTWGQDVPDTAGSDWWRAGEEYRIRASAFAGGPSASPTSYLSDALDCWFVTHDEARVLLTYNTNTVLRHGKHGRAYYALPSDAISNQAVRPHRLFDNGDGSWYDRTTGTMVIWDGRPDTLPAAMTAAQPWE